MNVLFQNMRFDAQSRSLDGTIFLPFIKFQSMIPWCASNNCAGRRSFNEAYGNYNDNL